jgi:hypothetical protein
MKTHADTVMTKRPNAVTELSMIACDTPMIERCPYFRIQCTDEKLPAALEKKKQNIIGI